LDVKGAKTIHGRASKTDTKSVSLTATVTASGQIFPPFFIFQGKQNGHIMMHEFSTYPSVGKCVCQDKAWMNEVVLHQWIDDILKSSKDARDIINHSVQPPIIFLDAYRVHQMGSPVNWIQGMGIEVAHIPAGCTYLCQPVNVGINKPIKSGLHEKWEDWMMEREGIVDRKAKEPTRKMVAE
jgi:hypothetical protein